MRRATGRLAITLLPVLFGCAIHRPMPQDSQLEARPVATLLAQARGTVERSSGAQQAVTLAALAGASSVPALCKQPLVVSTLADPWQGFPDLEQRLALTVNATSEPALLSPLLTALASWQGRTAPPPDRPARSTSPRADEQIAALERLLVEAARLRAQAVSRLTDDERQFLFDHAAQMVERFTPQLSEEDEGERRQAQADRRFFGLVGDRLDQAALLAAAQLLAGLDDEAWMDRIRLAFRDAPAWSDPVPEITGSVLLLKNSQAGLIVIGGPGPNTYDVRQPIALLLDLGGDDVYRGTIASPTDMTLGVSVLLDLDGNDRYEPQPLGLATGRLGVGLLVDRKGNDLYQLAAGSGGTGVAGIGLLVDREGDDRYIGSRLTQGAALGGLGLLLDRAGDDDYRSVGYALGFGGPQGTGALIDVAGHDRYQCGDRLVSRYNEQDAPQAKPGDTQFQYDCFGLGAGVGQRIRPKLVPSTTEDLAGGVGLVLDLAGNDRSRSANFSQGVGYFFGIGIKLDLRGDDEHVAARYGQGAAAHFSAGLFVDAGGQDVYGSTGPFYNAAAAWDRSVALFVDAGAEDDRYDFSLSTGLGIADHQAWSLFLDVGGTNRYAVRRGKGWAGEGSVSAFIGP